MALCAGIFLFITLSVPGICASTEDNDINALKQKITELEKRVKDLEGLLKVYSAKDGKNDTTTGWLNKKSWRNLKKGMTQEQVKKILGEPVKAVDGFRTIWFYPNFYKSYVSFDDKGSLVGWNEP